MVMFQRSVLFFFLFAVGCGESNSPTTDSSFPATTPSARNSTSAGTGSLDANLAYWDGMNSVPRQMTQHMNEGPDAQIWALRKGATVIRQNPTLGIDTDLVAWALRFADLLEQRAILIEQSRNPVLMAEAFARGMSGDPFGVAVELNQAERGLLAAMQRHNQEWNRLRATLTARYGVQFP